MKDIKINNSETDPLKDFINKVNKGQKPVDKKQEDFSFAIENEKLKKDIKVKRNLLEKENLLAQQEEEEKFKPSDYVEEQLFQTDPIVYKEYKEKKEKYEQLEKKTFGYEQKKENEVLNAVDKQFYEENDAWYEAAGKTVWNVGTTLYNLGKSSFIAGVHQATDKDKTFSAREKAEHTMLEKQITAYRKPILERDRDNLVKKRDEIKKSLGGELPMVDWNSMSVSSKHKEK
ncbi:MAG: hypothetical protein ACRC0V_06700, partial [Fusobacteriaceae bacterium]